MALVVEDGSGKPDADTYVSLTYANTYHEKRRNSRWAGDFSVHQREAGLIRAADYIDKRFGHRFLGVQFRDEQALSWPRLDAVDRDGRIYDGEVPLNIKKACAEYALRAAIIGVLAPDPVPLVPTQSLEFQMVPTARATESVGGEVIKRVEKVGPLEVSTSFQSSNRGLSAGARGIQSGLLNDYYIPEFPEADMLIESLLRSSMSTPMGRA